MNSHLTARESAELLGVTRETLYAYVSRGLLRSEAMPGPSRQRGYRREEVLELKRRKQARKDPAQAIEESLHFGAPILASGITLIQNGRLYYKGRDALELAETWSLEETAELLWGAQRPPRTQPKETEPHQLDISLERIQLRLIQDSLAFPSSYDLRTTAVQRTGWRVLALYERLVSSPKQGAIHESFQNALAPENPSAADLIRRALVLSADHELNVSAFAARCAASAGASPHDVLLTGLATMKGQRQGGQTTAAANLLSGIKSGADAKTILADRLRQGEHIPGFGHPLYPNGDCRGASLLDSLYRAKTKQTDIVKSITEAAEDLLGERPNLDWALAAIGRALSLPKGAPLFLFATGRTVGWLAQAIEQYESGSMIRPRAKYTGPAPQEI